ncbi:LD-carboxypeptidase [uncultured Muribaculum sp.]|uniref:S66 peptidase family protein n=1 Tax=uncultured Muribaculum sp. TaxID=1918613 RepID=UPI0025F1524E|nr:LD-carboxypeptidase [uncultured Muribaculum sp.]
METIFPRPLRKGDKIAIISPASIINPDYVAGACEWISAHGYVPVVEPHALGENGSYSGTLDERLADIDVALSDPDVRVVLCSRGGYGVVHLLPRFPVGQWLDDPRWLVGFSDISALHALLNSHGVVSIHASMCKALALHEADDADNLRLFSILQGEHPIYEVAPHPLNLPGTASGRLLGGNLAVISALISTPVSPFAAPEETILFIEDIAEPIYKVERIIWQLRLCGFLDRVAGVIVGRFTDYRPDRNHTDMYSMLAPMLSTLRCPVAFGFPVGHVAHNLPLLSGAPATLSVSMDAVNLVFV